MWLGTIISTFLLSGILADLTAEQKWLDESKSVSDIEARASKYDWTGVMDNPECPGNVMTLNSGEATRITSHKSFGRNVYPENYRVSFFFSVLDIFWAVHYY
jgi:hypothetical protein